MQWVGLYLANIARVCSRFRRSPSLDPAYTHVSSGLFSKPTTCSIALPTKPVPPVTNTTIGRFPSLVDISLRALARCSFLVLCTFPGHKLGSWAVGKAGQWVPKLQSSKKSKLQMTPKAPSKLQAPKKQASKQINSRIAGFGIGFFRLFFSSKKTASWDNPRIFVGILRFSKKPSNLHFSFLGFSMMMLCTYNTLNI